MGTAQKILESNRDTDQETPELSIVLPCLNESLTIATVIEKAQTFCRSAGIEYEIVVGDNGSTDGSQQIARDLGAVVVDVPVRGYGAAIRGAVQAANGRFVIMGDADDSYDFSRLTQFVDELRGGSELVMGNRFKGGIAKGAMPMKNRYLGNPMLSFVGKMFFGAPVGDFHCGLRGFNRESFDAWDLQTNGMEFASEMVIRATVTGSKISEVPTTLSQDGRDRPPHLRPWRDGWRHLKFMLLFCPRWLYVIPGLVLSGVSAALLVVLSQGVYALGPLSLDVHTLLFAVAGFLIGSQSLFFGLYTRLWLAHAGLVPGAGTVVSFIGKTRIEWGVVAGVLITLCGVTVGYETFQGWQENAYGDISGYGVIRQVIYAVFFLLFGSQIVMNSLLLGVLGLGQRRS